MEMLEQQARSDLLVFCILVDRRYEVNWHHRLIAEKLQAVEQGEIKRLILEMPPRHGKSLLASILFPAWYMGRNPEKEIITASYNSDLAQDFGGKTRSLVDDPIYKNIFDLKLAKDEKAKAKWRTSGGGTYTSVGIGGAITGRGAHVLIIDDPIKNREEANSDLIREKHWSWFTSTAYTRLEPDASVILILTRWHYDDLAGRLIEEQKAGGQPWEIVRFPAIAEEDEQFRKAGEPLWPKRYDLSTLNETKRVVGLMDWAALYQQAPIISETQEFKEEYFRYFEEADIAGEKLTINLLIDPAISKKDQACNTGFIDVAKRKDQPFWYVMDDCSGKMDPHQLTNLVFTKIEQYQKDYPTANVQVWIETIAFQEAYLYFFKEEMRRREIYFVVHELKSRQDKHGRIRGLIPLYKNGVIKHRHYMSKGPLEMELLQFPMGRLVDRIDALAFNLSAVKPTRDKKRNNRLPIDPDNLTGY